MDIRFLESFVTVADYGSIAEAARRLNVTPAALAQRLRTLEQDLGHSLVTRVGRTVRPTAAGLAVLRHARNLIESARDLRAIAANDEPAGLLRLGATATSLTGLLPDIISRLRARHPRIEYFIRPDSSVDLYHGVLAGELDAAVIVQPQFPIPKSTGWLTLREEPLVLIAPEKTELGDLHAVIAHHPFIRYDRNQWGGQIVDRYLREHSLSVREWLELDALDAIAALVSRGLGVAIVPDWAPPWPEGLKLQKRHLPKGGVRQTGVLWNRSGARIAAVRAFVDICGGESAE
ncbi:LysR substrate-binding domain-containing protein [Mesorhizobium sp. L-8-3]|uniref:LysR substrate-binding domain-containing protein n=1 Tax=Mesorhizobium sp. L-8-3 TaxID=2744522 RepID=UPI001925F9A2|nr:LysR substrate-binding domain-containing protein [Mesorhizobium sp. L-8-3]BCH22303.1 LysR family transcriptional regulator [Mesorhizobium sp. L-8-3]